VKYPVVAAGGLLVALPLILAFIGAALDEGLLFATAIFGGVALLGLAIFAGLALISKGLDL
jgi:hypothetical protein